MSKKCGCRSEKKSKSCEKKCKPCCEKRCTPCVDLNRPQFPGPNPLLALAAYTRRNVGPSIAGDNVNLPNFLQLAAQGAKTGSASPAGTSYGLTGFLNFF